jgi:hypothetical protein
MYRYKTGNCTHDPYLLTIESVLIIITHSCMQGIVAFCVCQGCLPIIESLDTCYRVSILGRMIILECR